MVVDIDEQAIRRSNPQELVSALANAKADALLLCISEPAILITADTVVLYENTVREKPRSEQEAREFLESYARNPVEVVSAIVVVNTGTKKRAEAAQYSRIRFKPSIVEAIDAHIANGNAMRGAGGFVFDDPILAPYIESFEGTIESTMGLDTEVLQELIHQVYV
ncbi:MAG: hypothetical protein A3C07_02440 [Candidatus Sungbacteria bacterium RIFCSPHIGHO2_02_FULL_47_11]|uniref:Nucleotide PPase n=1 Tax=Candidatus Sungbacteria bacterium RIFCSPHIGHO2_02_FULL_47_11 TaxID=1802270 RepID=A0A1G2KHB6_9BACT|nr:MAG: hypothetical protein A3C07_02440 [Candidatus Sungbacteria bacterium RIFCSPHIGHO2_02_FULL_47_11]